MSKPVKFTRSVLRSNYDESHFSVHTKYGPKTRIGKIRFSDGYTASVHILQTRKYRYHPKTDSSKFVKKVCEDAIKYVPDKLAKAVDQYGNRQTKQEDGALIQIWVD